MQSRFADGVLTLSLTGHIDALNAAEIESQIRDAREKYPATAIILDCDELEYSSSAGLRLILRLKQEVDNTILSNVHSSLYEILDTTGFTELMEVRKAFRVVSLEGCELLGQGANGKVYRMDRENIIKVYTDTDSLPEIQHERELARAAFVLGVPSAISYDVVQILEGGYGSVYELLNARTYMQVLMDGDKTLDELTEMSIDLLKFIHTRIVKQAFIPSIRSKALGWADYLKDYLPEELYERLHALIAAIPEDMHMVHGDYHFRNIMYQDGETLLIDMDKLSHGHPVFELACMYNTYCGFGTANSYNVERFLGIKAETAAQLWKKSLECYLGTQDEAVLRDVEDKAKIIGHARLMRHFIKRNGLNTEDGRAQIASSQSQLEELLPRVDTLLF